jgi:hypothetical protein
VEDINATLRWAEVRRDLDFAAFRPGKQLMCRNPGAGALGSKLKLLENLRLYCTARKLQLKRFFPETYKLDDVRERKVFFEVAEAEPAPEPGPLTGAAEGKVPRWICKPTGLNQGKGIFLVDNLASFKRELSLADAAPKDGGLKRWVFFCGRAGRSCNSGKRERNVTWDPEFGSRQNQRSNHMPRAEWSWQGSKPGLFSMYKHKPACNYTLSSNDRLLFLLFFFPILRQQAHGAADSTLPGKPSFA